MTYLYMNNNRLKRVNKVVSVRCKYVNRKYINNIFNFYYFYF